MATVISSPVIQKGVNRSLPTDVCVSQPNSSVNDREPSVENNSSQQAETLDIRYLEQIVAERDTALVRAEQAEDKLTTLQADLERLKNESKEQGFRAGVEQAGNEVKAEHAEQINAIKALLENLTQEKTQVIRQAEDAVVEVAFSATTKLLGRISTDNKLLESLVKESTRQVLEREGLVVYLAPSDCQRMQQLARGQGREWIGIEFKADEQIQWGGCRVVSRSGSLDARLELQLSALKDLLVQTKTRHTAGVSR